MKTEPNPDSAHPALSTEHAVYVLKEISGANKLYKVSPNPSGGPNVGEFTTLPVAVADSDAEKRLIFSLAGAQMPSGPSDANKPHMAFGILPLKPEPNGAHFSCYLLNEKLLYGTNIWSRGDWNGAPKADAREASPLNSEVLLATTEGLLVHVDPGGGLKAVDPKENAAAWRFLRSGSVVGMVPYGDPEKLVPLVNLAAFVPPLVASGSQATSELTGTLDFKWPKGSVIRIRIDEPNAGGPTAGGWTGGYAALTHEKKTEAVNKVRELVQLWLDTAQIPDTTLTVAFVGSGATEYDVFINLDPLAKAQSVPAGAKAITAPESALGTYAQRSPLGTPTSYCGHPEGLKDESGNPIAPGDYYSSKAFTHIVLHELGHVWGLAHLHQHPAWRGPVVQASLNEQLQSIIKTHVGLDVDDPTLQTDLRGRWPGDAQRFAHWPDLGGRAPGFFAGDSIMMGHPVRGILEGDTGAPRLEYVSQPGSLDIEWLRLLYA